MTAVLAALCSVVLAGLVALAGYAGTSLLAVAVALAVLLVAIGWAVLLGLPDVRGTSVTIALTGWAALGVAYMSRTRSRPLAAFATLLAAAVLVAFVHELLRRDRTRLVESITGTVSGQVVAVLGAGWLLLPATVLGRGGVAVAAATVAGARLVRAVPLPSRLAAWTSWIVGAAAGTVAGAVLVEGHLSAVVAAAVAGAGVVAGMDRLVAEQPSARTALGLLSGAAAPVTAIGTVAYAAARLLAG